MAGTVTILYSETRTIKKVTLDWLSDASGDATADTKALAGQILRVVFIPDSGGTQPSNLYDVVLNDADSIDVLEGLGANLSNTTSTDVVPVVTDGNAGNMAPVAVDGKLSLAVSNGGNAKGGKVILYIR